jgi:hypothetical protein
VGEENLLPRLFTEVVIPKAVLSELLRNQPKRPDWLRVYGELKFKQRWTVQTTRGNGFANRKPQGQPVLPKCSADLENCASRRFAVVMI